VNLVVAVVCAICLDVRVRNQQAILAMLNYIFLKLRNAQIRTQKRATAINYVVNESGIELNIRT